MKLASALLHHAQHPDPLGQQWGDWRNADNGPATGSPGSTFSRRLGAGKQRPVRPGRRPRRRLRLSRCTKSEHQS
jgi:hypothetical protein